MVAIGNEITHGMLWPDGRLPENWNNFTDLLKAGITREKVQLISFTFDGVEFAQKIALRHEIFNGFIVVDYSCVHFIFPEYAVIGPVS